MFSQFSARLYQLAISQEYKMVAVADIPSREVLLSRLLGSMKSPISSFARVLNEIGKKKGEGESA